MDSVFCEHALRVKFDKLTSDAHCDVLIVGGGIAGVLCAYMLRRAGVDCILAEADRILGGTTQGTTAKITLQHGLIYSKLIGRLGREGASLYLRAQMRACDEYERLCADIPCDYENRDSYVYSLTDRRKIEVEAAALGTLGFDADITDTPYLPFSTAGAVRIRNQAQFNPLKFLYGISQGLPIYENTKVTALMPGVAVTDGGTVSFNKVIVATHFPIVNKHGAYFLKMYQHRSYVLALAGVSDVRGMYVDESDTGLSFRSYKNFLLFGGGAHRTGKKGGSYNELERLASEYYPDAKIVRRWAAQDCMTLDGYPYIGKYSAKTSDMYVATGFNKWGMSSAMVAATILTDLVRGADNEFSSVFSPSRSILHPKLAVNAFESLLGLLTPTVPRCPHLGCALKYNAAEHSWDCPCHGSRFTESGELINNPATDDKKNMP